MPEVPLVSVVADRGMEGDASFGRLRRQALLADQPTLGKFNLHPGQTRENIALAGISLTGLPAGTCLRIGEAVLEVTGDCAPCGLMDSIRPGPREAIRGQRGALARVHQGGIISVADTATIVPAPPS